MEQYGTIQESRRPSTNEQESDNGGASSPQSEPGISSHRAIHLHPPLVYHGTDEVEPYRSREMDDASQAPQEEAVMQAEGGGRFGDDLNSNFMDYWGVWGFSNFIGQNVGDPLNPMQTADMFHPSHDWSDTM